MRSVDVTRGRTESRHENNPNIELEVAEANWDVVRAFQLCTQTFVMLTTGGGMAPVVTRPMAVGFTSQEIGTALALCGLTLRCETLAPQLKRMGLSAARALNGEPDDE